MWQRIQTVYLVLAIICCLTCLTLPVATITTTDMTPDSVVYNLFTVLSNGSKEFPIFGIINFVLLLSACTFGSMAIFTYKNRKLQALECALCITMTIIWIAIYSICAFSGLVETAGTMQPSFAACLPIVALILFVLARKAILKDEALVRAADRIR